ncbi:hypothetical protein [Bacillus sp. 1P06AnD]|uniref:hypothetical protein n=1 Tax=Bacillus sp. 1P06AnD TaxID=3132208 RepID=UPI0039A3E412
MATDHSNTLERLVSDLILLTARCQAQTKLQKETIDHLQAHICFLEQSMLELLQTSSIAMPHQSHKLTLHL